MIMKNLLLLCIVLITFGSSCTHLPADPYPNYSALNFQHIEFVHNLSSTGRKVALREMGIANGLLSPNQSLDGLYVKIIGIWQGTLWVKSQTCGIDFSTTFQNEKTLYLKDLISKPTRCTIEFVAETDQIKKKQHNIVEVGKLKLGVLGVDEPPAAMSFARASDSGTLKTYSFVGQGSLQRPEGGLTTNETIDIETLSSRGFYRIVGCNKYVKEGSYSTQKFSVPLKSMYESYDNHGNLIEKDDLAVADSCDFDIDVMPADAFPNSFKGVFAINIYGSDTVKLPVVTWEIDSDFSDITIKGLSYVVGTAIDYHYCLSSTCNYDYDPTKETCLRAATTNGRKSVVCLKDNKISWEE